MFSYLYVPFFIVITLASSVMLIPQALGDFEQHAKSLLHVSRPRRRGIVERCLERTTFLVPRN